MLLYEKKKNIKLLSWGKKRTEYFSKTFNHRNIGAHKTHVYEQRHLDEKKNIPNGEII